MIQWQETTQERFDEMLGVLPPASMSGGGFLVGEAMNHRDGRPTFEAYLERDGQFFVSKDDVTFAEFKAEFPGAANWYR